MTLTPQLIKDQEFQVKFRGCDPLEVRDYLETIADEFFELQEQCKEYLEELELLRKEKETSEDYNSSLETDMEFTRKISEELKEGCVQKEEKLKELSKEVEELQLRIADMEQENVERDEEVSAASAKVEEAEAALKEAETEKESLRAKIELLREQNSELKKEEVDFKSALATAQQFAEDLKEKSRLEAEEMIAAAKAEIEQIRDDAHAELTRLPVEIAALKKKKSEVKEELKSTLESYLETIDVFYPDEDESDGTAEGESSEVPLSVEPEAHEADEPKDLDDLFEKIEMNEDGSVAPEDFEKLSSSSGSSSDLAEDALENLLRGDQAGVDDDEFNLKDMFTLELKEEKNGSSS